MQTVHVPRISEAKRTVLASVAIWRRDGVSAVSGKEGSMSTDTGYAARVGSVSRISRRAQLLGWGYPLIRLGSLPWLSVSHAALLIRDTAEE